MKKYVITILLALCTTGLLACNSNTKEAKNLMDSGTKNFQNRKYEKAIEDFEKVTTLTPESQDAYNDLYKSLARESQVKIEGRKENLKKALEVALKALELSPESSDTLCNVADAYSLKGNYEKAIEYYKKAIEQNNDFVDPPTKDYTKFYLRNNLLNAYIGLAFAYGGINKLKESIETYEKAIEMDPENPYTYYNLARTYSKNMQYKESIEYFNKAITLEPKDPGMYNDLGLSCLNTNQPELAKEYFEKAVKLNPKYVDPYNNLATYYNIKGETEKAREMLEKTLELEPDYPEAKEKLSKLEKAVENKSEKE